jgi:hypothetical protein
VLTSNSITGILYDDLGKVSTMAVSAMIVKIITQTISCCPFSVSGFCIGIWNYYYFGLNYAKTLFKTAITQ